MPLDDLLPRCTRLLEPRWNRPDEREAWIDQAFYGIEPRLQTQLDLTGTTFVCSTRVVKTLLLFGCLSPRPSQHALARLLRVMRAYAGEQDHAEFDTLIALLDQDCLDLKPAASVEPTPAPPDTPIQTIDTPQNQRSDTVFISYSHDDADFANTLIQALNAAGHACWIDAEALKAGERWSDSIARGIRESYAFLIVCTQEALASRYVKAEIRWAVDNDKLIIPLLLEDVTRDDAFFELKPHQGIAFFNQPHELALKKLIAELPLAQIALPAGEAPTHRTLTSRRTLELRYLDRLRFDDFRLDKFELAEYAALGGVAHTYREQPDDWEALAMKQEFAVIRDARPGGEAADATPEAFTDAVSKIAELRRVVVLGEPGAGKTHTLRAIAKPLYTAALSDPTAPIPLLVKLGNWDQADQPFEAFLRGALGELGAHLDDLLATQRAILLFDGLNEFPADQRTAKYAQVEAFIKAHPKVMAVVTCREADYPVSLHLNQVQIRPLDPLRIRDFAQRALRDEARGDEFFWKLAGGKRIKTLWEKWERAGADLKLFWSAPDIPRENPNVYDTTNGSDDSLWHEHVHNPASVMRLASSPYMLRMLLDVYIQFKGVLPSNRGQLFAQFVDVLLEREQLAALAETTRVVTVFDEGRALLTGLQQVAFEMQMQRAEGAQADASSAGTSLPLERVRVILDERLLYLAVSTSILNSGADVRFSHQLLQEYFAARYMDNEIKAGRLQAAAIWKPANWWERTNWEEAAILLAGLYSDDCTPVLNWLADANPETAALCIARSGAHTPDTTKERLRTAWLPRLIDLDEPVLARAAVGRALGTLLPDGAMLDNRPGVGLRADGLPDIVWCEVPAGAFTYQDGGMTLDYDFQIARCPVTYAQFQAFIDAADGFTNPTWWDGLAASDEHKAQLGDQAFKYGNHPRERVSWYDAVAFCRWLSVKLGYEVRLPSQFEWERAARENDDRQYPYEGENDPSQGNISSTGIKQTVTVGIFPNGASPVGALDMSGNVWEWCLTKYGKPVFDAEKEDVSSDSNRVLHGGSWYDFQFVARSVFRGDHSGPYDRGSFIGFRLCRPLSR